MKNAALMVIFSSFFVISSSYAGSTNIKPPTVSSMEGVSHPTPHSFAGMGDAVNFILVPNNRCGQVPNQTFCFNQLVVPYEGASNSEGAVSCPAGYGISMTFGNDLVVNGTSTHVIYTLYDERNISDSSMYQFYLKHKYTCVNGKYIGITTPNQADYNTVTVGEKQLVSVQKWSGSGKETQFMHVSNKFNNGWDTQKGAYMLEIEGYAVVCKRQAGFWQPSSSSPDGSLYPSATPGPELTPTVVICGKLENYWNKK